MPLPKIDIPTFSTTLPSTKNTVTFRPFLVKEEKILLMANQGNDENEKINAIKQIVNNCMISEVDVDKLPTFDVEWLFLQLRKHSVGDVIDLQFQHIDESNPCKHITQYKLNLEEVKIKYSDDHNKNVKITENITLILKYPTLDSSLLNLADGNADNVIDFLSSGIEFIKEDDKMHETKDYSKQERLEFFEQLTQEQMQKIQQFYETSPAIEHEIKYKCEGCGSEETVILRGLQDFLG
tara:strand:+ start:1520 stop:2233 length:714 start_codon:yes stop_codon:yes gene_type:complete